MTLKSEDRGVHEGRVDREPDDRDEAEEAVEEEQEERDEEEADPGRDLGLVQRVLPERRRDLGLRLGVELDGQRAGLQHEREVLGLVERDAGDLGAVVAGDPVRVLGEVDRRERLDLVVEDDREALEVVARVALASGQR